MQINLSNEDVILLIKGLQFVENGDELEARLTSDENIIPKILVSVEGGCVTSVFSDTIDIDVVIVDYDVDGLTDDEVSLVHGNRANVMEWDLQEAHPFPEEIIFE